MPQTQRFKPSNSEKTAVNWPSAANYKLPEEKPKQAYSLGARFDEKRTPMYKKADGTRFDSQIRAKPHLRPKKMDGPGPGDYQLPGAVRVHKRNTSSTQHSTFGGASREWSDLPQNTPGPNAYS